MAACERNQLILVGGYRGLSSDDQDVKQCALHVINPEPRTSLLQVEHANERPRSATSATSYKPLFQVSLFINPKF